MHPGAHHVRFLVDGQWLVADDLPAAVDDQGTLANYVAVYPLAPPQLSPPPPPTVRKLIPGQSFWSAASTDGINDNDEPSQTQTSTDTTPKKTQDAAVLAYVQAKWTNVLPLELIEAQKEEEIYLAASAGQFEATQQTSRVVVTGFVPAPNIPPAPGLPRHLDKLILNPRIGEKLPGQDRTATPGSQGSGVGSGQGGTTRRERRDREERRDRDRDRDDKRDRDRGGRIRRPNVPPPPPPSEDGSAEMDIESTYVPMNHANGSAKTGGATSVTATGSIKHQADSSSSSGATSNTGRTSSTAVTTPQASVPVTPPLSPTQSSLKSSSVAIESVSSPQQHILTAVERSPISGSRTITIDTSIMPTTTDDASVLPVPSHVVLHHLCTSAIKNGVLAVGNTTRYKKKVSTSFHLSLSLSLIY